MSYQIPSSGYGKGMPSSGMMPMSASFPPPPVSSGMMPAYGKGMPMSGMMPSMSMKGYGKRGASSGRMGKHDWEIEEEQGFFGGITSFLDDEEEVAYYPPHNHDPMVPIPWQQPKKAEEEEEEVDKPDQSLEYLSTLSTEMLQEMAETRKKTMENLQREVDDLSEGDAKHEERLVALEKKFGQLCQGSDLKFKAPLLSKISKMVRDSHLLDHDADMDRMKGHSAAEQWADLDPWAYIHSDNLAMGRNFMRLDQHHIAKMEWKKKLESEQHPVVNRVHYAGHIVKPAEELEAVFVKEAGVYKKHPLHPAPYRNNFWLSMDGPTREDAQAALQAEKDAISDPVAKRVQRQNIAGTGEDAQAVDWLGKIKHGEMIDEQPPGVGGFRMPSWMY